MRRNRRGSAAFLMKLISWNVNGVRSVLKKGLLEFMTAAKADVFCLQEIKCHDGDVQQVAWPKGYEAVWHPAQKKGYAGTAMIFRHKPLNVTFGIGMKEHDTEGRVITAEFPDWWLVNVYTPNSQRGLTRLDYRVKSWDGAFLKYLKKLEQKNPVVFCGDLNVAHAEIDLTNPKTNRRNAGFTDEERGNFGALLAAGYLDTLREFEQGPGHYTWWSQMMNCRARNIGWRVDYFVISSALRPRLKRAWISPEITGSDHCPVGIEIE
jgi:exodeoxyribonuclease-3